MAEVTSLADRKGFGLIFKEMWDQHQETPYQAGIFLYKNPETGNWAYRYILKDPQEKIEALGIMDLMKASLVDEFNVS